MRRKIKIEFREQELEDMRSAIGIAQRCFKKGLHKDSPNFRGAVDRLDRKILKALRTNR